MPIDFGDGVAIAEGVALVGSWVWLQTKDLSYSGWRRKAAFAALVCASLGVISDLILTGIMHFLGAAAVGASLYLGFLTAIGTISFFSLILALLGRGSPRMLSLIWSLILLSQGVATVVLANI